MEPDLLGYLMNALDADERRALDQHLEDSPEARRHLVALRHTLRPLEAVRDGDAAVPPDLFYRTLRKVAHARACRQIDQGLPPASTRPGAFGGDGAAAARVWGKADVFLAASIALFVLLMIPPALLNARQAYYRTACEANLKALYAGLMHYATANRDDLPRPEVDGARSAAGVYAASLRQAGYWDPSGMALTCPATARQVGDVPHDPPSLADLDQQFVASPTEYARLRRTMGGGYGYHLGYLENGKYRGVRRGMEGAVPILADRPPRENEVPDWKAANSPNHGGLGQNVLFLDGHVQYLRNRTLDAQDKDDLFLNKDREVAAGKGWGDHVLAVSEAPPFPPSARTAPPTHDPD
jgi:prepilin-type processing-associated H-X9-DG protein